MRIPLLCTVLYLCIGALFLRFGFPAEDAFILFKYVREFGSGNGIVFFPGGPHTEGATDFLWMMLLSALYALGLDPAIAALLVNAVAAGIAAAAIGAALREIPHTDHLLFKLFPLLLLFLPSANAGYVGFSVQLFSTGALLLFLQYTRGASRLLTIPLLALLLGLIRPDGVIIGGGFVALGAARAWKSGKLQVYLAMVVAAAVLGMLYFIWRYSYFGLALPLPLFVKGHSDALFPTLVVTLRWVVVTYARYLAAIIVLIFLLREEGGPGRLIEGLLPFVLHLAALSFSDQSQNIAYRFQGPEALVLFCVVLRLCAQHGTLLALRQRAVALCALFAVLVLPDAANTAELFKDSRRFEYVNQFAFELGLLLPPERAVAITEAGRLGYWSQSKVYDLVGLNNPDTATVPPTLEYLESIAPDLVMVHHAGTMNLDHFGGSRVVELESPVVLRSLLRPEFAPLADRCTKLAYLGRSVGNVKLAPICAINFIDQHRGAYRVFAVLYQGAFSHLYGVKRGVPEEQRIVELLYRSATEIEGTSYLELLTQGNDTRD